MSLISASLPLSGHHVALLYGGLSAEREVSLSSGRECGAALERLGAKVTYVDAGRYFDLHHSADDTLDKIDPKELAQNVAVWTAFVYAVADSDIDFRKTASAAQ